MFHQEEGGLIKVKLERRDGKQNSRTDTVKLDILTHDKEPVYDMGGLDAMDAGFLNDKLGMYNDYITASNKKDLNSLIGKLRDKNLYTSEYLDTHYIREIFAKEVKQFVPGKDIFTKKGIEDLNAKDRDKFYSLVLKLSKNLFKAVYNCDTNTQGNKKAFAFLGKLLQYACIYAMFEIDVQVWLREFGVRVVTTKLKD